MYYYIVPYFSVISKVPRIADEVREFYILVENLLFYVLKEIRNGVSVPI